MDFLTIISTCSLHRDLGLVIAMVVTFSHGNPYMVVDAAHRVDSADEATGDETLALPAARAPKTRVEANAAVERIVDESGSPIVGLLPVSPAWTAMFDRKPSDAFDPCMNITIATAMLSEFAQRCGAKGRACVLHQYAEAIQYEYFDKDVIAEMRANAVPARGNAVIETAAILQAPIFTGDGSARSWGADQIFFPGFDTTQPTATPAPKPKSVQRAEQHGR